MSVTGIKRGVIFINPEKEVYFDLKLKIESSPQHQCLSTVDKLYTDITCPPHIPTEWHLTYRHRASCILGQAFHYSPENAFYIFNQQIYLII